MRIYKSNTKKLLLIIYVGCVITVLATIFGNRFLPFYDYHQWVYQVHILHQIIHRFSNPPYKLSLVPIPNSGFLLLSLPFIQSNWSPEIISKFILIICIIVNIGGLYFLIISVHHKLTVLLFLPVIWLFNYYLYSGFISYYLSLGIFYIYTGYTYRATKGGYTIPKNGHLFILVAINIILYLSHLFGWLSSLIVSSVLTSTLWIRHRKLSSLKLLFASFPSILLLIWYTFFRQGVTNIQFYNSLLNKIASFLLPLLLFFRIDPFDLRLIGNTVVSIVIFILIIISILSSISRRKEVKLISHIVYNVPLFISASILVIFVLIIPFTWFGGLGHPDERFFLPAFWLGLVSLRYKPLNQTILPAILLSSVSIFVLVINFVVISTSNQIMEIIYLQISQVIPSDSNILSISYRDPPVKNSCKPEKWYDKSIGIHTMQWFELYQFMEIGRSDVKTFSTSFLQPNITILQNPGMVMLEKPRSIKIDFDQLSAQYPNMDYILIFGCNKDLSDIAEYANFNYTVSGDNFLILSEQAPTRKP